MLSVHAEGIHKVSVAHFFFAPRYDDFDEVKLGRLVDGTLMIVAEGMRDYLFSNRFSSTVLFDTTIELSVSGRTMWPNASPNPSNPIWSNRGYEDAACSD